jgi:nucleoside-diphosphate-sugar epimerase
MPLYLVTGGAGFIGSHVVDTLVARGDSVRVVDDFSTGKRGNLAHHDEIDVVEADLANPGVAESVVSGVDYVVHIAAIPSVPRSVKEPLTTHRANVDGTLRVLIAARDASVTRVVFASSSSVYGDSPTLPIHEEMPTRPLSPYALQKLMGEHYMRLFHALYGLDTVALRFFNVFGPRQDPGSQYSGVISLFTAALCEGRQPTIFGDGEQTRDFTYVSDVADGVVAACHAPDAGGQMCNLACGGRTSLNRLFEVLRELIGASVEPVYGPPREGDARDSQADATRAKQLLGFEGKVTVEDGLRRTVEWYRAQG